MHFCQSVKCLMPKEASPHCVLRDRCPHLVFQLCPLGKSIFSMLLCWQSAVDFLQKVKVMKMLSDAPTFLERCLIPTFHSQLDFLKLICAKEFSPPAPLSVQLNAHVSLLKKHIVLKSVLTFLVWRALCASENVTERL